VTCVSSILPIAALAALAAAGLARQRPPARRGSRSAPPARFLSEENALRGEVFYHGSDKVFSAFDPRERRTSYGMFFAKDQETARFYGNHLYKVLLYAKNPADLDEPAVLRKVAEAASWGGSIELMRRDRYGEHRVVDGKALAKELAQHLDAAARVSPQARDTIRAWLVDQGVPAQDLVDEHRQEVLEEQLEYEDFWTDHPLYPALPEAFRAEFVRDFFKIDANVRSIEEDYGTDAFYLNHQDEVLRAAEGMGYDAVMMADPSSVGESWSCVVFSPTQVFILGRSSD